MFHQVGRLSFGQMVRTQVSAENWPIGYSHGYLTRLYALCKEGIPHVEGRYWLAPADCEALSMSVRSYGSLFFTKKPSRRVAKVVAFALLVEWGAKDPRSAAA